MYNKPMQHNKTFLAVLILALLAVFHPAAMAEDIYKWTDSDGNIHYSNKSEKNKNAEVASLPEISKGEVKLPQNLLDSCSNHAGVNCQAGADSDGSVICNDGFTDSAQRFAFLCSTAKLEVSSISKVDNGGGFVVNVRNSKSVAAENPSVTYKFDSHNEFKLNGPDKIQPFEVAEFIFDPDSNLSEKNRLSDAGKVKPSKSNLHLSCTNCP